MAQRPGLCCWRVRFRPGLSLLLGACGLLMVGRASAGSAQFAGTWTMTTMRLTVTVESWGDYCGPEPKSYATNTPRPVEINDLGSHLVFSSGGGRTDRCWSPNPRIESVSELIAPGRWERVCQTQKGDPKFERGEYSLVAKGQALLEYKAISRFDWTLKESHCVALLDERRTYVREGSEPASAPEKQENTGRAEVKVHQNTQPGCDKPGALAHFNLTPRRVVLGPGQRACFKVTATDAKGCEVPVNVAWSASQDGVAVSGLVAQNGCFSAGETAADAEGTYAVTAKFQGRSDEVEVVVAFPELGELLAARLKPLSEPQAPPKAEQPSPSTAAALPPASTTNPAKEPGPALWIALGIALLMVAGLGVTLLLFLKRRAQSAAQAEEDAVEQPAAARGPTHAPPPAKKACPSCGRTYEAEASFCPHDRSRLIELQAFTDTSTSAPSPASGMICPRCHRGYEAGSRFCPHDAESLVAYGEWKATRRSEVPRTT
ncbi:MAG: hypothetical protein MUC50_01245 [Myxococcota bacterium]|nr:hypothetical protein [Myxococcota bacterium]